MPASAKRTRITPLLLAIPIILVIVAAVMAVIEFDQQGIVTPSVTPEAIIRTDAPEITESQDAALTSVEQAVELMPVSRARLLSNLELEGFSTEDANFAIDFIGIDFKHQAVLYAEASAEALPVSPNSLEAVMQYDEFTAEEIAYATEKANIDWRTMAVSFGQQAQEESPRQRPEFIEFLQSEGFSPDDATYAADELGL